MMVEKGKRLCHSFHCQCHISKSLPWQAVMAPCEQIDLKGLFLQCDQSELFNISSHKKASNNSRHGQIYFLFLSVLCNSGSHEVFDKITIYKKGIF